MLQKGQGKPKTHTLQRVQKHIKQTNFGCIPGISKSLSVMMMNSGKPDITGIKDYWYKRKPTGLPPIKQTELESDRQLVFRITHKWKAKLEKTSA